jgi:hypothetical protein
MNIVICSYDFGPVSSEGICTERLVQALLAEGCEVTLATSKAAKVRFSHENFRAVSLPTWPGRLHKLFTLLTRIFGGVQLHGPHYAWVYRVWALKFQAFPTLIYGRALPFSSLVAAGYLSKRFGVPLVTHFSDPVPDPWKEQDCPEVTRLLPGAGRIVQDSQAVTFPTIEGLAYQERVLSVNLDAKGFVLNHIAPPPSYLPPRKSSTGKIFGYFGAFYEMRTGFALLEGFAEHLRSYPDSRFVCVGTSPEAVLPTASRLGILEAVSVHARVDDIRPMMGEVDVLVSVDAAFGPAIFLPTKLVEYLVVNRPILLISPADSPGAVLARRFDRTVVHVATESPEAIAEGLRRTGELDADKSDYAERFARMDEFSGRIVAKRFLDKMMNLKIGQKPALVGINYPQLAKE